SCSVRSRSGSSGSGSSCPLMLVPLRVGAPESTGGMRVVRSVSDSGAGPPAARPSSGSMWMRSVGCSASQRRSLSSGTVPPFCRCWACESTGGPTARTTANYDCVGASINASSQVQPGALLGALAGHGVQVPRPHDQVGLPLDFDLVLFFGVEEHLVADLHGAHVAADPEHLAPDQPFGDLGRGRDHDTATAAAFPGFLRDPYHDPVMQHLDL